MKKRILAICLTLVLLLCALPFAAAADDTNTVAYLILDDHLLNDVHIRGAGTTRLAVGDTIKVAYYGNAPADVIINGQTVHTFAANEEEVRMYEWKVTSADSVSVKLCTADKTLIDRTFTIISDKEMYRENLSVAASELGEALKIALFPSYALKVFEGTPVPVGNAMLGPVLIGESLVGLFKALFSFTRL